MRDVIDMCLLLALAGQGAQRDTAKQHNVGAIVGGTFGAFVLIALVVLGVLFFLR